MDTRPQPAACARHRSCFPCQCPQLCGELSKPCTARSLPCTSLALSSCWGCHLACPRANKPSGGCQHSPGRCCSLEVGNSHQQEQKLLLCGSGEGPVPAGTVVQPCSGSSVCLQRWFYCCPSSFPHFFKKPFIKGKKKKTQREEVLMLLFNFHASVGFCAG